MLPCRNRFVKGFAYKIVPTRLQCDFKNQVATLSEPFWKEICFINRFLQCCTENSKFRVVLCRNRFVKGFAYKAVPTRLQCEFKNQGATL